MTKWSSYPNTALKICIRYLSHPHKPPSVSPSYKSLKLKRHALFYNPHDYLKLILYRYIIYMALSLTDTTTPLKERQICFFKGEAERWGWNVIRAWGGGEGEERRANTIAAETLETPLPSSLLQIPLVHYPLLIPPPTIHTRVINTPHHQLF